MSNATLKNQKPEIFFETKNNKTQNSLKQHQNIFNKRHRSIDELINLNKKDNILRNEFEIMREAFQTQVSRLRNTNQCLEKRIDDLEERVDKV